MILYGRQTCGWGGPRKDSLPQRSCLQGSLSRWEPSWPRKLYPSGQAACSTDWDEKSQVQTCFRVCHQLNSLATSCEELTHWKRLWCWEGLGAGGEGDDRGWDGWMASLMRWAWVWVNSGSGWWTGRPGVLRFTGSQRVRHDWETELTELMMVDVWSHVSTPSEIYDYLTRKVRDNKI